jgi:hypothetical protein
MGVSALCVISKSDFDSPWWAEALGNKDSSASRSFKGNDSTPLGTVHYSGDVMLKLRMMLRGFSDNFRNFMDHLANQAMVWAKICHSAQ